MKETEHPLETRLRHHLFDLGLSGQPAHLLVALSGGCDSVVLLHLLHFRLSTLGLTITAAHLDHAMREESAADAVWVQGLCNAWGVHLLTRRLGAAPQGEADARQARYAFLRASAEQMGTDLIATAHHADDQAETVLFRAVRGTGLKGLAGIAPLGNGLIRPLLPFWRRELEAYARQRQLTWRTDASNAGLDPARNRLRHEILPLIEAHVAPTARRKLVSLAALAHEAEEALERLAVQAETDLLRWEEGVPVLARDRLRAYDSAIVSRVLRNVLRRFGVVLGRTGTRRAIQFITDAPSGRQMPLSGGLRVETEFDEARFRTAVEVEPDRPHRIEAQDEAGEAEILIGGATFRLRYGRAELPAIGVEEDDRWSFVADPSNLVYPLSIRGWQDGDRMRTERGGRSLKQIFLEQRVPRERRRRMPVLVDGRGDVLWVAGVLRGPSNASPPGEKSLILTVLHA